MRHGTASATLVASIALLLVCGLAPAPARAADAAVDASTDAAGEAEALIQKGLGLRRQGDERAALPFFQRAHELARSPRSAAQLGFVEQALGLWSDAEAHFGEALGTPADPWIREHRGLVEESSDFVKRNLGLLQLDTNVHDADVLVDGRVVGQTPLPRPLRVAAGQRHVELRAAGFRSVARDVGVSAGHTQHVAVELVPLGATPQAEVSAAAAPKPLYTRWWLWAGVGAVVIAAVAIGVASTGSPSPFPCGGGGRVCAE
jgi:hypothetical protein